MSSRQDSLKILKKHLEDIKNFEDEVIALAPSPGEQKIHADLLALFISTREGIHSRDVLLQSISAALYPDEMMKVSDFVEAQNRTFGEQRRTELEALCLTPTVVIHEKFVTKSKAFQIQIKREATSQKAASSRFIGG